MDYIKEKVKSLKKKHRTSCPFELCDALGINVFYYDLPECVNGFFFKCMKNYIIIINDNLPFEQQRVTAAHELGHIILHGKTNSFQLTECTDIRIEKLENEADYFASCLLIDEQQIRDDYGERPLSYSDVACISRLPERMVRLYAFKSGISDGY